MKIIFIKTFEFSLRVHRIPIAGPYKSYKDDPSAKNRLLSTTIDLQGLPTITWPLMMTAFEATLFLSGTFVYLRINDDSLKDLSWRICMNLWGVYTI